MEQEIQKNRKYRLDKKTSNRIAALAVAGIILLSGLGVGIKKAEAKKNTSTKIVTEYYGEDSKENTILDYIEISRKLNNLGLDNYKINFDKEGYVCESTTSIEEQINNFNKYNNSNDKYNLNESQAFIDTVKFLKAEEELVNNYIYNSGYNLARENLDNEITDYAKEQYGLDDNTKIKFGYHFENSDGSENVTMTVNKNGDIIPQKIKIKDKMLKEAVIDKVNVSSIYDFNYDDNDEYNEDRNQFIIEGLKTAAEMSKFNDENDVYSEKEANRLLK